MRSATEIDEELRSIRSLMEQGNDGVYEGRAHYLSWGIVVCSALLLTYASVRGAPLGYRWIWGTATTVGWGLSLWIGGREHQRAAVHSVVSRMIAGVWIGCGIAITLAAIATFTTPLVSPQGMPALSASILGAGFFTIGFARRSRAWLLIAAGWWLGAVTMLIWRGPEVLLIFAGLIVLLEILPALRVRAAHPAREQTLTIQ